MKFGKILLVILAVAAVAGCSSRSFENRLSVESTLNPEGNYGSYRTYAWVKYNTGQVLIQDPQTRSLVVEAIENALKAKGLTYDPENPDLMVGYHGAVEQKLDEDVLATYYDEDSYHLDTSPGKKIESWDVGTLVLMIFDSRDGTMLWRASAQAELDERASKAEQRKNLRTAVDAMLATLPTEKDIEDVQKQKSGQ